MNKPTYNQLEYKIMELNAQMIHVCHFASATIDKTENLKGSGVLLQLTFLGGKEAIPPIVIRDGLSRETINAIKQDIKRTYEAGIVFKPK
jgi:hypothetical protein